MFKPPSGYTMATKASDTLILIIEKQHASWDLTVIASHVVERRFCHRLRHTAVASALTDPATKRRVAKSGRYLHVSTILTCLHVYYMYIHVCFISDHEAETNRYDAKKQRCNAEPTAQPTAADILGHLADRM